MKIAEVMTADVEIAAPDDSLHTAAKMMADLDIGVLPIGENDRLVGMVTDRDIAIRGVAAGRNVDQTKLREVMTKDVKYCFDDEDTGAVAQKMAEWQVRRLPVLNRDKRLIGIVSLGDLAIGDAGEASHRALKGVSEGAHAGAKPGTGADDLMKGGF
jgi:CBS domain-containing protein